MDHHVSIEESYSERRQLFKNIWQTAMNIEDKDTDIMSKPKVIKTLRLDELDRFANNKKKKIKLKNLRTVCNKILNFCDQQEAGDQFYEQMIKPQIKIPELMEQKKIKTRNKKKTKKSKSLQSPARSRGVAVTDKDKDEPREGLTMNTSTKNSPTKRKSQKLAKKISELPKDITAKGKKNIKRKRQGYLSQPVIERT